MFLNRNTFGGYGMVRAQAGETERTVEALEQIWKEVYPDNPFEYHFLDQEIDNMYKSEQRLGKSLQYFRSVGNCDFLSRSLWPFGLPGGTSYTRARDPKSTGCFRVSTGVFVVGNIYPPILMLTVIAIPIAWVWSGQWLSGLLSTSISTGRSL